MSPQLLPSFVANELAFKIVESGMLLRLLSDLSKDNELPLLLSDEGFGLKLPLKENESSRFVRSRQTFSYSH
jgi:hypothetical protein